MARRTLTFYCLCCLFLHHLMHPLHFPSLLCFLVFQGGPLPLLTSEFLRLTQCWTPFWLCGSAVAGFSVAGSVTVSERLAAAVAAEPVAAPEPAAAGAAVASAASGPLGMIQ